MPNPDFVALTALPRELTAYAGAPSPPYQHIWRLTVQGSIPATQVNRCWHVARADIPAIAALLGMAPPERHVSTEQYATT